MIAYCSVSSNAINRPVDLLKVMALDMRQSARPGDSVAESFTGQWGGFGLCFVLLNYPCTLLVKKGFFVISKLTGHPLLR